MTGKHTQQQMILAALKRGERLTIGQIHDWHINGATKRISELRAQGHHIADEWHTTENGKRYKVYFLVG